MLPFISLATPMGLQSSLLFLALAVTASLASPLVRCMPHNPLTPWLCIIRRPKEQLVSSIIARPLTLLDRATNSTSRRGNASILLHHTSELSVALGRMQVLLVRCTGENANDAVSIISHLFCQDWWMHSRVRPAQQWNFVQHSVSWLHGFENCRI